ncbi:MAG: SPOR domain-containing protein [Magnetococcus sp. WYHC-3]
MPVPESPAAMADPAPPHQGFVLQLASYLNRHHADALVTQLQQAGFQPWVVRRQVLRRIACETLETGLSGDEDRARDAARSLAVEMTQRERSLAVDTREPTWYWQVRIGPFKERAEAEKELELWNKGPWAQGSRCGQEGWAFLVMPDASQP